MPWYKYDGLLCKVVVPMARELLNEPDTRVPPPGNGLRIVLLSAQGREDRISPDGDRWFSTPPDREPKYIPAKSWTMTVGNPSVPLARKPK